MAKSYKQASKPEEMDYDQRWEIMHKEKKKIRALERRERGTGIRRTFFYSLEILTVGLSYLERSRLARFITTKVTLDTVVEVTARFGKDAGHRLSTVLAALTAEPYIIAVALTVLFLLIDFISILAGRSRKKKLERLTQKK